MNPLRKALLGGAVLASTLGGGALGAAFLNGTATAADSTTTTTAAATTAPAPTTAAATTAPAPTTGTAPTGGTHGGGGGPHQANGITETVLTGDAADKVTAAALEAVPGATVNRVETDADGDTYEAHLTKADGTVVTVKLDASYNVTKTVDGMG